jgi:hypothetical protein
MLKLTKSSCAYPFIFYSYPIPTTPLTQQRRRLVNLINRQPGTRRPQPTPCKARRVIRNLYIRHRIRRAHHKPRTDKRRQTRGVTAEHIAAQSRDGAALCEDAGEHGDGEEGHLLDVVGLGGFGALVFLEAVAGLGWWGGG